MDQLPRPIPVQAAPRIQTAAGRKSEHRLNSGTFSRISLTYFCDLVCDNIKMFVIYVRSVKFAFVLCFYLAIVITILNDYDYVLADYDYDYVLIIMYL